jgi:peptide/nickel transport system permease protein
MMQNVARALGVLGGLLALAILAPMLAPYAPNAVLFDGARASLPPQAAHWLGTDPLSRDVLSRLLDGARVSLGIAFTAVTLALGLGTLVGAAAALGGRVVDSLLMRITDTVLAFPRVLLLLLLVASIGPTSTLALGLLIGCTGWMTTARLVRHETSRLLTSEHLLGARALGVPPLRLLRVHLLPAIVPTLIAAGTVALAAAIPLEAALSYLGLGVPTPQASWGNIIAEANGQFLRHWWLVLFPTAAIVGSVWILNAIAERLAAPERLVAPKQIVPPEQQR